MKKNNVRISPFLLSLAVHGVLAAVLFFSPTFSKFSLKKEKVNQVELLDPDQLLAKFQKMDPNLLNGQIVEQDKNPLNDEKPKDAKFLSRHNQQVVKETQSANKGKFKNTDESSGEKSQPQQVGKQEPEQKTPEEKDKTKSDHKQTKSDEREFMSADNGVGVKSRPSLKDLTPSFKPTAPQLEDPNVAQGGGSGPSATDDHLKNVATGMQTLLSTREFVYYTYYNRIKDKLRQYWEPKIKEKMTRIMRQGRTVASTSDKITRVVIFLDNRGTLVRVKVLSASGMTDLDDAAVEAFKAAAPFPNPPKGIVEADGFIKIRWDFILEA